MIYSWVFFLLKKVLLLNLSSRGEPRRSVLNFGNINLSSLSLLGHFQIIATESVNVWEP